uniref:Uncharacterized protein n=1 Tax=Burkholderia phage vB_BgluM-SURPRISE13 TaxID=3159457 RepID=A0AAU7PFJ2_9VIRU
MLKIDRNAKGFKRIQTMAAACFRSEESIGSLAAIEFGGHANITASGFIVRTLYKGGNKPINENLLLKALNQGKVFMPQLNISNLLVELHVDGVAHPTKKGYVLTDSMMELIGEYMVPVEPAVSASAEVKDASE